MTGKARTNGDFRNKRPIIIAAFARGGPANVVEPLSQQHSIKNDDDDRESRIGDTVVKRFGVPASHQERLLSVFEEECWPSHIDHHQLRLSGRRLYAANHCVYQNRPAS